MAASVIKRPGIPMYRTWMVVLGLLALMNLLFVVDDPGRWWSWISTAAPLTSGAYMTMTHRRIKAMNAAPVETHKELPRLHQLSIEQGTPGGAAERETTFIAPRDRHDTFCTCPRCGLLGTTSIQWGTFRKRTLPGLDGDEIDVSAWGDPPDGTPITTRTCGFCAHTWSVSDQRESR